MVTSQVYGLRLAVGATMRYRIIRNMRRKTVAPVFIFDFWAPASSAPHLS